jgi:uncharacterized protein
MATAKTFWAIATFLLTAHGLSAQECAEQFVDIQNQSSRVRFSVEIADDESERAQGLMFRESLPQFSAMLFVYEQPIDAVFWMHNTLVPLDMLFMDQSGTVLQIIKNATPKTDTARVGGPNIKLVLEINGGLADKLGLTIGSIMRHPAIDPTLASWKCAS